jgi:SAM-dependent methyltransferase/uncharacterized protein YbaR (Trm112 family)
MAHTLDDLLACPRCGNSLETTPAYRCNACQLAFSKLDGIPCLFADPDTTLGEWRHRLHLLIQTLERDAEMLGVSLSAKGLMPRTRDRLQHLREGKTDHADRLKKLLEPLDLTGLTASYETHVALRTQLPPDQGLTTYYDNIHRDWNWGGDENAASLQLILDSLGDAGTGERVLVLGAGAGRLAYDLHQASRAELTVAMDFNPLLALLADTLMRGEIIELYEFPIAPRTVEDQAVLRMLQAPATARDGIRVVLADALHPPFSAGSFETVVTPWLVDILPEDFRVLCRRVNRLLAPGGRWVLFGSLAFHHANPALCYSLEECVDAIKNEGYSDPRVSESVIPYMCSPSSRHGRQERIVTVLSQKRQDARNAAAHEALPEWLMDDRRPVPLLQSFQTQAVSTRIYSYIMSLIDGQRSASDIAAVVAQQGLMSAEEAGPTIRTFLTKMYRDSERQSAY